MKKTLTEQWKDGTLEQRYYYVKYFGNCQKPFVEIELKNFLLDLAKVKDNDRIEVLAPVPSYEEWQNMREENTIHNHKAAKRRTHINNLIEEVKALKEELKTKNVKLNELRQQRNEANEVLKDTAHWATDETENQRKARDYLEKWGVK